ncbi:odorant-binding protein 19b [Haematobia irritans]|uniref:odorant-binding protein 19b n=1 Tax=Haematobia irritans TaxID=7368 RepID=UPI003F4FEB15
MQFCSKLIICLSLIVLAYADDDEDEFGMTSDELVDALEPFAENCDPKPDREHIKQMIKNDENPHQNSKCFRHCLMKEFELIGEGSTTMDPEKAVDMLGMMFSEGKDDMEEIVKVCNEENSGVAEKCENAHKHGMCILRELKARNYKIPQPGK